MGMYDTMAQKGAAIGQAVPQVGGSNGGSFAQKQMLQKNPMMKRPSMSASMKQPMQGAPIGTPPQGMKPNPMTGARPALGQAQPGQMGSNSMQQQKMLQLKNTQAAATGGAIGGSYDEMVKSNPMLQNARQTGINAGQDMSWMDKPGAISLPQGYGQTAPDRSQSGLQPLQTPYEQQIQASKPDAVMGASQAGPAIGAMGQTFGRELQAPPFTGEQPGSNGFQSMMESYGGQRPDVMDRGIGPSAQMFGGQPMDEMQQAPVVMDENGLEPRRGAR